MYINDFISKIIQQICSEIKSFLLAVILPQLHHFTYCQFICQLVQLVLCFSYCFCWFLDFVYLFLRCFFIIFNAIAIQSIKF